MVIPKELTIKGYELLERIGEGAYGAVYRAYQPHMRREVAIKIIQPRFANQPNFIRRFDLEAHLVAQLEHLHIVPLHDYWREPDGAYLVMRLMKGGSLEKSLKRDGPWEPEQAVQLVDQIASALDAAHQQGVVHRDLKPANILLDEQGNAYLSDFGIAKQLQRGKTITQTGAIVGTPAYISPEQVQSQRVTPQSDIYALGVVVYELLVGGHPFMDTPTAKLVVRHLNDPLPLVSEQRPEISQDVDRIIQRATEKDPESRYEGALDLALDFHRAMQLDIGAPKIPESEIYNPYKGLRTFQESDARDFYGREMLIRQLLLRLQEIGDHFRFLAVVGPSGSGKSSVVKAGLVPALREGGLPGSGEWFITQMKPGTHPLEELELAILRVAVSQPPSILGQIREDARGTLRAVRRVLPEGGQLLLVIDQLEELFTLVRENEEASFFMSSIFEAVSDSRSPLRVVATLRADYFDRPLKHPEFCMLIEERTQVVKPLSTSELEQAICEPANRLGITIESGLTSTIVGEVHEEPGALPILQYALTELFERREGRVITREAYDQIGGVRGALARRAEEIYVCLEKDSQPAARQLFLRLVTLGEGQEDTRRRVLRSEVNALLGEFSTGVIDSYGDARLLTFDHDQQTREPTVEVAHEALLQEWGRLREWLDESRADIRLQRVLGNAAEEWDLADRNPGFLLRGSRLDQFEAWMDGTDLALTDVEVEFIDASLLERKERELLEAERLAQKAALERRSRNFLRALVAVLAVAMTVSIVLAGLAFNQRSIAEDNAATATYAQGMAINEAATAVAAQEEALEMGVALSLARVEADRARKLATVNELVAFAKNELDNPGDVSYSLALLLAHHAVKTSLDVSSIVSPGAEDVLRQAIESAPRQNKYFAGHSGLINHATWSPDGLKIATASDDGTIVIWDVKNGEQIIKFGDQFTRFIYVDWSPDGKDILSVESDHNLIIWNVDTGEELLKFQDSDIDYIRGTATWNTAGTQILTASEKAIILWDAQTGDKILKKIISYISGIYTGNAGYISNFAHFSPTEEKIVTRDGNYIIVMDAITGDEMNRFDTRSGISNTAQWSKDEKYLLTAHDLNSAIIWEINSGDMVKEFIHSDKVISAAWNSTETQIATVTADGTVTLWDSESGRMLQMWQANSLPILSVEWSTDDRKLLTAGADGVARIWEIGNPGQAQVIKHTTPISTADWTPDGKHIFSSSGLKTYIWDVDDVQQIKDISVHSSPVFATTWEPKGDRIASGDGNGFVVIWDSSNDKQIQQIQAHSQTILSIDWSPDGEYIITGSQDRVAKVWSVNSGDLVFTLRGHSGGIQSASWSPDNEMIITSSTDNTAIIWDARNGEEISRLIGHSGSVNDAAWSLDGRKVLTASNDRTVRIWEVATGLELDRLIGHSGAVLDVELSPDGQEVITASDDQTSRRWDSTTGEEIGKISGHGGAITEARWSPDGMKILTASTDKTVRIWPVGIEGLLVLADSLILRDPPEFTPEERCLYLHECGG